MDKLRSLLRTFNVIYTSRVFEEQLGVESLGEDLFVSLTNGSARNCSFRCCVLH